ncbi:MAG: hypothetical protein V1872_07820, partial [bacterium]
SLGYLKIINLKDVTKISSYSGGLNSIYDLMLEDSHVYLIDRFSGRMLSGGRLNIINILDPTLPSLDSSYELTNDIPSTLDKDGNYIYLGTQNGKIKVLDISNISSPSLVSDFELPIEDVKSITKIHVVDNTLYAAVDNTIKIVDVTNKNNLRITKEQQFTDKVYNFVIKDNYAYVAAGKDTGKDGLRVIDLNTVNSVLPQPVSASSPLNDITIDSLTTSPENPGPGDEFTIQAKLTNKNSNAIRIDIDFLISGSNMKTDSYNIKDMNLPSIKTLGSNVEINKKFTINLPGTYTIKVEVHMADDDTLLDSKTVDIGISPTTPTLTSISSQNFQDLIPGNIVTIQGTNFVKEPRFSLFGEPQIASSCLQPLNAFSVAVKGQYAYVVDDVGLKVIDISDPEEPIVVSGYPLPSDSFFCYSTHPYSRSIYIPDDNNRLKDYAFVANIQGLSIINISDPFNPLEVGHYEVKSDSLDPSTWRTVDYLGVYGNYVYINGLQGGFGIINISDINKPSKIKYPQISSDGGISIKDGYAYVIDYFTNTLKVLNLETPNDPVVSKKITIAKHPQDICISGNYAYVISNEKAVLSVINLTTYNIKTCDLLKSCSDVYLWDIYVTGDYAYVAAGKDGLIVIDIKNLEELTNYPPVYDETRGVYVVDNYAYVAEKTGGLVILNKTNLQKGEEPFLGTYFKITQTYCEDVEVSGNYAYIAAGEDGVQIMNISDPENPVLEGNYNPYDLVTGKSSSNALGIHVVDDYFYIADWSGGLKIVDIRSQSLTGLYKGQDKAQGCIFDVHVLDNYAYLIEINSANSGLRIIDISNKSAPKNSSFFSASVEAVSVRGNYAYLACGSEGFKILDVSNKKNPQKIGSLLGDFSDVYVSGNYAYVVYKDGTDKTDELMIIDISTPSNPKSIGSFYTPEKIKEIEDIVVLDNYAYIAAGCDGLHIINVSNPSSPQEVDFCPTVGYAEGLDVKKDGDFIYVYVADGGLTIIDIPVYQFTDTFITDTFIPDTDITSISGTIPAAAVEGMYKLLITSPEGQSWILKDRIKVTNQSSAISSPVEYALPTDIFDPILSYYFSNQNILSFMGFCPGWTKPGLQYPYSEAISPGYAIILNELGLSR